MARRRAMLAAIESSVAQSWARRQPRPAKLSRSSAGLGLEGHVTRCLCGLRAGALPPISRKKDAEHRSRLAGGGGLHFNLSADLVDDALDDPQADARTLLALSAEEWLEDGLEIFLRNSAAGVAHTHNHLVLRRPLDRQRQVALFPDSVDGVRDQVGEYLAQLAGENRN